MVCKQCGCTIPKGTKFQQTKYKSSAFCSEECFNTYDKNYTVPAQRQLTDYIQSICDIEPNWPYITKQSKAIEKEYGLSQKQQLIIIRYAVEFEGAEFNSGYGLGQFFPKYQIGKQNRDQNAEFIDRYDYAGRSGLQCSIIAEPRSTCRAAG